MKLRILFLFIFFSLFCFLAFSAFENKNESFPKKELNELSSAIRRSDHFESLLIQKINQLKNSLPESGNEKKIETILKISELYNAVNTDSSIYYSYLAKSLAELHPESQYNVKSEIAIINSLSTAGIFSIAVNALDSIKDKPMSPENKLAFWMSGRQLYSYIMSYIGESSRFYDQFRGLYLCYDDSLLQNLPRDSYLYQFIHGERLVSEGKYNEAKNILSYLIDKIPLDDNLYGKSAYQMALICQHRGEDMNYGKYLALAARSDVESCVKEGLALPALAKWLYDKNELDEAFHYINFALADAMSGNARMRTVTIATTIPIIDSAYKEHLSSSRDRIFVFLSLAIIMLIASIVLLVMVFKQKEQSDKIRHELSEMTTRQNSYIGNFLGLCSTYADKLNSLNKLVSVKIASGQTDELLRQIRNRYAEDDDEIHSIFDNFFLDLYPGFIFEINRLLREDEQIILKKGEALTPELRIYALVRLGIDESTRIASILHYSVSTIYAYRNRMRNKAIDRENFDKDVTKLCIK